MGFRFIRRFIKKTFLVLLAITCIFLAAWFGLRNVVLHKVIDSLTTKFSTKYNAQLTVKESSFTGFASLTMVGICLVPENKDTLLEADTIMVQPSLTALLTFRLKLNSISVGHVKVNMVKRDSASNYAAFLPRPDSTGNATKKDYAAVADRLMKNAFYYLPAEINLNQLTLFTDVNGIKEKALISLSKHRNMIDATLNDLTQQVTWKMEGDVNSSDKTFSLRFYNPDDIEQKQLPFIEAFADTRLYFNTLSIAVNKNKFSKDKLNLTGKISAAGLMIHYDKISQDDVLFNQLSYDFRFIVSDHAFIADSLNLLQVNDLSANAGFSYSNDDHKSYSMDLKTGFVPANDFFSSLPKGMFNNFEQMKAEGQLQYTFHFKFNTEMPDSLQFSSSLKKEKFRITQFGITNFAMMNGDFVYTAYENDKPFRTIEISASNPNFTPLQNIPDCFKNAVLTSEDGSFFFHNGFNEEAFKKSIAENYKAGKFVRGGSTITMQLVKNVFLSRHKTIARKAEEALIVWLIENNHLVSKERMLEVYLNIIELGPNVYGVSEAAEFYFNKKPAELTLAESIFLASLLPRPKWFKYSFDKDGLLKPYFADYFRVVSNFLLKKNLITQDEYDHLKPEITLKGPARNVVTPVDSLPPVMEEEE